MNDVNKLVADERSVRLLQAAHRAWSAMATLRSKRRRFLRFTYGDQWSEPVKLRDGSTVTEGEEMVMAGARPLTNNLIRRMVKAVVGRYRLVAEADDAGTDTNVQNAVAATDARVRRWREFNCSDELDARTFEEFLISGMAVQRVSRDVRQGRPGVWVDIIDPEKFFVSGMRDIRGCDMELVGRVLDLSPAEVCMRFARGSAARARRLRSIYGNMAGASSIPAPLGGDEAADFFQAPEGRCRVVEVWTLESREMLRVHDPENATMCLMPLAAEAELRRVARKRSRLKLRAPQWQWEAAAVWRCRMMAPDGTLLAEYDSPLRGGGHPYAVKMYPLVDGDVHSLVEDVIEQQRHVNRLITTMDRMLATTAKGVLLFPVNAKIKEMDWDVVSRMWSDPGGVIPYVPQPDGEPHQVAQSVADLGANQLLKTQIEMFQDVSGVSDTLMGRNISAGIGAERYRREVENSAIAVNDLIKTFSHFVRTRDSLIAACS